MKKTLSTIILSLGSATAVSALTLKGASQFDDSHAYNRGMLKFGELISQCDSSLKTRLQGNSSLGNEKDFLNFMAKGNAVDYAIVSPGHMANYSNAISLLSMPFLFRSKAHWKAVVESDVLEEVNASFAKKADVIVLGVAGGSIRNIISNVPVASASDVEGLKIRVQGAPIHTKMWSAFGAHPAAINYNEVYNAIQTNVVNALENGAAGLEAKKFYEVAPHIGLTRHTITIRPLLFSGKTFRKLNAKQKNCVQSAGRKAGDYARLIESSEDQKKQDTLKNKGLIKVYEIKNHATLLKKAEQVKKEFASNVGATDLLKAINKL